MGRLDSISSPKDLKQLNIKEQEELAKEIREKVICVVNENGGHLSSNLGIIETTIAVHKVFNAPTDKIIFDVGHQCYAHKMLTGRQNQFSTVRKQGGLSGFPDKNESEYDVFTTGHAGNSISLALGLCTARDLLNQDYYVVVIVGDGSLVNGLNLEAITASSKKPKKLIVVLNDNGMSISKNTNGFYKFLSKRTIGKSYVNSKNAFKKVFKNSFITKLFRGARSVVKRIFNRSIFFENYGFKYVGVTDGNDLKDLNKTLEKVKTAGKDRAILLHVSTVKGKGSQKAESQADLYHGVSKKDGDANERFSSFIPKVLNSLIEKDNKIVTITAAMKDGTGLKGVEEAHPNNFIDVGILEEYAVSLSAGLATGGLKPIVFLYSTFMQRAYDQILHDVCLQNLPVVFCIDRAGLVGDDGKTHQGVFDLSFLSHMPNLTILSVMNEEEFNGALNYALSLNSPVAIRYPKDATAVKTNALYNGGEWVKISGGENAKVAVLTLGGRMLDLAVQAKKESSVDFEIYSVRRVKPLDYEVLNKLSGKSVITLEENALIGGFNTLVKSYFSLDEKTKVYSFGVPDEFIPHGSVDYQLGFCGLTKENLLNVTDKMESEK